MSNNHLNIIERSKMFEQGVQVERHRVLRNFEVMSAKRAQIELTMLLLGFEIVKVMQAVATGTYANNNPAIIHSLQGMAGKLAKAYANYREACLHAGYGEPDELEPLIEEMDTLITTATGGDCNPIKQFVEQHGADDLGASMLAAATVPRPGRPAGRSPAWVKLVEHADTMKRITGERWREIAKTIKEEWRGSDDLLEREAANLLPAHMPGDYLMKEVGKHRNSPKNLAKSFMGDST